MLTTTSMPRLQFAALTLACASALPAWAQTAPPTSGQLLEETRRAPPPALPAKTPPRLIDAPVRPTVTMPEGATVEVSEFRISGAVSFAPDTLAALVRPWTGRRLDIKGLNEAAGALTRHYQANGHLLSYAYVPAQRVADGVIELAVLEGKVEGIQVVTAQDVRLAEEVVQAHTEPLAGAQPLLQADVERKLLLLNDMPGVTARAAFTPGASTGGADMVVSVAEADPLEVRAEVNNHGAISTGHYRAGLHLQFNDLFGRGDSTLANGFVSSRGSLITGSLSTLVPVGGDGWKLGASLARLKYQLAGDFRSLGAVGQADTLGFNASYPLRRTADSSVTVRAALDHKRLRDEQQVPGIAVQKRNDTADLGGSFDYRDGIGGVTAASLVSTFGQLRVAGSAAQEWHKLALQAVRLQSIAGPVSLYARVAAQTTGSNLDSSEKLGLGGASAVRAYAPGEASVDRGTLASLELRYGVDFLGGSVVGSLFHDYGSGQINRRAVGVPGNDAQIHGSGLGLSWSGSGVGLNATLAWRGRRIPTTDENDPRPRLYFQFFYTP